MLNFMNIIFSKSTALGDIFFVYPPTKNTGSPTKNIGSPTKNTGAPTKNTGAPIAHQHLFVKNLTL